MRDKSPTARKSSCEGSSPL